MSNFCIQTVCIYFGSWTPTQLPKMVSLLLYGEICWTKLSFPHSESEFVWEVSLGLKVSKFCVCHYLLNTKLLNKSAIRSILRWDMFNRPQAVEQNMSYAIFQYFSSECVFPNWIFDDFMIFFRSLWVLEQFFLR
jgi:hypothetical protein